MFKILLSTDRWGFAIDTDEWLIGISFARNIGDGNKKYGSLLQIGFLCFNFYFVVDVKESDTHDR